MSEILETIEVDFERIPTEIEGSTPEDDIIITHKAIEVINAIRSENNVPENFFLRIATRGGGCSGMSYNLGFDSEIDDMDRVYNAGNLKLVIDAKSLFYLMGVTLDYTEGPHGSGFIFNNPNNMPTCGCNG
ncbi:MAG: iron-sulfur cluster assembly accessory protein [Candidatus Kapabacteria bacterium]|nr:iron-sulfur cluster assembly accessory protein [Candidatus Kapabacteria bacterium]